MTYTQKRLQGYQKNSSISYPKPSLKYFLNLCNSIFLQKSVVMKKRSKLPFLICYIYFCCAFTQSLYAVTIDKKRDISNFLIINSYNESAPWSNSIILPVLEKISEEYEIEAHLVHMNANFITNDSLYQHTENELFRRYKGELKPSFLILVGSLSFNLRNRIKEEWGDIPMLLCAEMDFFAPRQYYFTGQTEYAPSDSIISLAAIKDHYNLTYLSVPHYYKETIDMMVQLQPEMKKLLFAADKLYLSRRHERLVKAYLFEKYPHIEYGRLIAEASIGSGLRTCLIENDPTVGMLFSTWFYARENLLGQPTLIAGDYRLIMSSSKPVFTLRESYVEEGGFVGGYFCDSNEMVTHLIQMVDKILRGIPARDIPFYYPQKSYPLIDYKILKERGLSEANCPQKTRFINKPLTLWERYKLQMITGSLGIAILLIIIYAVHKYQRKEIFFLKRHNTLLENMPIFYAQERIIFNDDDNIVRMEYMAGNALFKQLFTTSKEANGNKSTESLIPRKTEEFFLHFVKMVIKEKRTVTFTYYFEQTNVFYEIIIRQSSEANVIDFFGLNTTTLHETENLLRLTNNKLAMALDVAHIIPWRWDLINHLIICDTRYPLFEAESREKEGAQIIPETAFFQKIHPDDVLEVMDSGNMLIKGSIQSINKEFRIVSKHGTKQCVDWMEVRAVVEQRDENGVPIALIGSLLIISDRKKNEQELIKAKNRAEESDRLKSAFLANMSHEIRTPLNAIVGFSSILATTDEDSEKQEYISIIENNNHLLLQLISDVLDLAKIESGTLEFTYSNIDLNELMKELENTVSMHIESDIRLNFVPGTNVCHINTERNRLSQVIINLLNNAIKFTPQGEITFGYTLQETEIKFYVKDTGCGIPKDKQDHIFDRFVKLNSFTQGTGLGLSICQNIITRMEGKIGVESKEDRGSTFWFTLPYNPGVIETVAEKIIEPDKIPREKVTILIAEDNDSNYLLFKSILQKDYQLLHAWDGAEAVELFKKHAPNIILMDINMPNMDGYEATHEIRKLSEKTPIIAITAYAYASDKKKIMENGFDGYMSKPLNAKKLHDEISKTLNKSFILL